MKTFRAYDQDQVLLMPPSLVDWVDEDHPARLVSDLVDRELDLSPILASYSSLRGQPPYDPRMLLKLLLHGYTQGLMSSRKLQTACSVRVDFMYLAAGQRPDFRTISDFRKRHLDAIDHLFDEVLRVCTQAGLVKLNHVAVDGTKMKANASMKRAMSYGRISRQLLEEAERIDAEEDALYGDSCGTKLPPHLADPKQRREALRRAKRALEDRASERVSDPHVRDKDQYNFVDPDSRVMQDAPSRGWMQAYNSQAAVDDSPHKIVVAADVSSQQSDNPQLESMVEQIGQRLGRMPKLSADPGLTARERMQRKLRTKKGRALYKRRKHTVEPVFGHIKHGRGTRQYLLRGIDNVTAEWKLICLTHNIGRLAAAGYRPGAVAV